MQRFLVLGLIAAAVAVVAASVSAASPGKARVKHVLLISVDGLHQSDLEWYVANHPSSELAKLVHGGAEFGNAHALAGRIAIAICQRPPMRRRRSCLSYRGRRNSRPGT